MLTLTGGCLSCLTCYLQSSGLAEGVSGGVAAAVAEGVVQGVHAQDEVTVVAGGEGGGQVAAQEKQH